MKRSERLRINVAALLLLSSLAAGQTSPSLPESKPQSPTRDYGSIEILTDTQGVDFGPYLRRVLERVRENWYRSISSSTQMGKKGKLAIEFAIAPEGRIADMRLVATSCDPALDRAAWNGITASNFLPALPNEFKGPFLALRFHFYYNPDKSDLSDTSSGSSSSGPPCKTDPPEKLVPTRTPAKTKSEITVTISGPVDFQVPLGGLRPITAFVTGTGAKDNTVEWTLSGLGCSGASCGEMMQDSYHAPNVLPDPPTVTVTATSNADRSAKASATVHLVPATVAH
jgi:TonB family protein